MRRMHPPHALSPCMHPEHVYAPPSSARRFLALAAVIRAHLRLALWLDEYFPCMWPIFLGREL